MTYCHICQSEQDARAIQYAEVNHSVSIGACFIDGVTHSIAVCSDCIATHSNEEFTELLITISETK